MIFDNLLSVYFHLLMFLLLTGDLLIKSRECVERCIGCGYLGPRQFVRDLRREPLQVRWHLPLLLIQVSRVHTRLLKVLQGLSRSKGLLLGYLGLRQGLHKGAVVLIFQRVIVWLLIIRSIVSRDWRHICVDFVVWLVVDAVPGQVHLAIQKPCLVLDGHTPRRSTTSIHRGVQYFYLACYFLLLALCCLGQIQYLCGNKFADSDWCLRVEGGYFRGSVILPLLFILYHHWSSLVKHAVNAHIQWPCLRILSQVYRHRFIVPFVPCCLVQSQVIPEVEGGTRLEVWTSVHMVAPWPTGHLIVREPTHRLKDCSSSSVSLHPSRCAVVHGVIIMRPIVCVISRCRLRGFYVREDTRVSMIVLMIY